MKPDTAFDDFVDVLDYPMFVVTVQADGESGGCLVGFATQASIDPPRFLVGLSTENRTTSIAGTATHLAVHLLPRELVKVAELFGGETGDAVDKFERCDWHVGPEGTPVLDSALAWFVGEIIARFDMGDHVGHLLAPVAGGASGAAGRPVFFDDVKDLNPGHGA
ncbi:flavin reductase [Mycolicibacterium mucogenicum DSM 44124]|uniref:Flavin reductase family protein n=2 Tax=Mycolicibacterium mucogenicum TaxID=56689 RepID=A0A8H2JCH3_MYCMU|nr:flavin reductase family protein [Mycolicibacterium mucogenicum]KAB7751168.1 flavin reductase [Mycolicibacterium mucogenicum DSM 44124]QPG66951.1 flavin reductase family protein [Mycolicibacterium mucogenicum DSM 44124]